MNKKVKEKKRKKLENKKLIKKYPFLEPTNRWTARTCRHNYEWTELDLMPEGWRKAFGEQMCEEIYNELKKFNYVHEYRITDIKEKYGTLRWYDAGYPIGAKITEIIDKYEEKSAHTCMLCGAPAELSNDGYWYDTICDKCKGIIHTKTEEYYGE